MKFTKLFAVLFLFISLISCKDNKEEEKKVVEANYFTITLNVIAKKDDNFQVYFKEINDDTKPFDELNSVTVSLKGSDNSQDVVFNLPEDVFPTNLRLDFGTNKEMKEVVVNNFTMKYKEKTFEAKGANFFNYFNPDENFEKFDVANSKIIPIIVKNGDYDPMVFSNDNLDNEILKLSK